MVIPRTAFEFELVAQQRPNSFPKLSNPQEVPLAARLYQEQNQDSTEYETYTPGSM